MISPNGKIKSQVSQNSFKNQTVWDGDLFKNVDPKVLEKVAIIDPLGKSSPTTPNKNNDQLNRTLDSGNMRGNNVPNNPELKKDFGHPPIGDAPLNNAKGIGPSNNSGLSPFLSPDGSEQQEQEIGLQQEKIKLRQAAGTGFAINLKRSKEGAFEVIVIPPRGFTIPNPDEFATALMKAVNGTADEIGDPDPNTGAMKIVYKSQFTGPQKVMKGGKK